MSSPYVSLGASTITRVVTDEPDSSIQTRPAGFVIDVPTKGGNMLLVKPTRAQWKHHIKIWKGPTDTLIGWVMWRGECLCGFKTQYHAWGATLGCMMQHQWKEMY